MFSRLMASFILQQYLKEANRQQHNHNIINADSVCHSVKNALLIHYLFRVFFSTWSYPSYCYTSLDNSAYQQILATKSLIIRASQVQFQKVAQAYEACDKVCYMSQLVRILFPYEKHSFNHYASVDNSTTVIKASTRFLKVINNISEIFSIFFNLLMNNSYICYFSQ